MNKKLKVILSVILILGLGISSLSCSSSDRKNNKKHTRNSRDDDREETEETTAASDDILTETFETDSDFFPEVTIEPEEDPVIIVGTNAFFPPFEYYDGTELAGIDIEIMEAISERTGIAIEWQDMDFDLLFTRIQEGSCDVIIAGITPIDSRLEIADFSTTYYTNTLVCVIPFDSDFATVDDILLEADYIGVQSNSTGAIYITDDVGEERTIEYENAVQALDGLEAGEVEVVIIPRELATDYLLTYTDLCVLPESYCCEYYGIAVNKDNPELLARINEALDEMLQDGTIENIVNSYIY